MPSLLISAVFAIGFGYALAVQAWTWAAVALAGWLMTARLRRHLDRRDPAFLSSEERPAGAGDEDESTRPPRITSEQLKEVTNALHVMICVVDSEERFVYANQSHYVTHTLPGQELLGKTLLETLGPVAYQEIAPYVAKALAGERVRFETILPAELMGRELYFVSTYMPRFNADGSVNGFYSLSENLSQQRAAEYERQALEKRMVQSQKLESLGVLAGGIAHDFNNLLTHMMSSVGLARRGLVAGQAIDDDLDQIEVAAKSASDLCRQMLEFSGRGPNEAVPVDLPKLVNEMHELLEVSAPSSVELEFDLEEAGGDILGDGGQLRQVLFTLVANAAEAMTERSGKIYVRTREADLDREALSKTFLDDELPEGRYALLEVEDEGCGMDKKVIASLFDPFFSTKFTGRGLGLASTLGIVRSHRGAIEVHSEPEVGTRIRVALPIGSERTKPSLPAVAPPIDEWQGEGTVLVVDDDPGLRRASRRILEGCGLETIVAEGGEEALAILEERGSANIDLIVLDLTMPGMDGAQTLAEIRKREPDTEIPVLLCSGYSEAEVRERCDGLDYAGMLPKPFGFNAFASTVRGLLES